MKMTSRCGGSEAKVVKQIEYKGGVKTRAENLACWDTLWAL